MFVINDIDIDIDIDNDIDIVDINIDAIDIALVSSFLIFKSFLLLFLCFIS